MISPTLTLLASDSPLRQPKRPDLQGDYFCGSCLQKFSHRASLNRHRIFSHNEEVMCLLCSKHMEPNETVKEHFLVHHSIKSFTCSCCAWSFADKQALNAHTKSMRELGEPGSTEPVAKGPHAPGSLLQEAVQRGISLTPSDTSSEGDGSSSNSGRNSVELEVPEKVEAPVNTVAPLNPDAPIKSEAPAKAETPLKPLPIKRILKNQEQLAEPSPKRRKTSTKTSESQDAFIQALLDELALKYPVLEEEPVAPEPTEKLFGIDAVMHAANAFK